MTKFKRILTMHAQHPSWTTRELANYLGIRPNDVLYALRRAGKKAAEKYKKRSSGPPAALPGKPEANRPANRTCLNCRQQFGSFGWGNKLCDLCRDAPDRNIEAAA